MKRKTRILVVGAGAIGRGFIPWVFPPEFFEYYFDDINDGLINKMYKRGKYTTWMTVEDRYEPRTVRVGKKLPRDIDIIVTAVGPRNFLGLADRFMETTTPIICCENDSRLSIKMREITGNPNIFFAIPDVITSNTAPKILLDIDDLSIVTEMGSMFIEDGMFDLPGAEEIGAIFCDSSEMKEQWMAKLYLHNTPHCIAAYMGREAGKEFIHEAMELEGISAMVRGAISEMTETISKIYKIDHDFCEHYGRKEIKRFENRLLYDPISRVAREPMRKLALTDRLVGAAMLAFQAGITPAATIRGIISAIRYDDKRDPDYRLVALREKIGNDNFIQGVLHVRPENKLYGPLMAGLGGE